MYEDKTPLILCNFSLYSELNIYALPHKYLTNLLYEEYGLYGIAGYVFSYATPHYIHTYKNEM
jgi:hypothetical protein